jgi:hypothetical protein
VPSFFRPSFFFDRRPLSRRHAGPLYLSRAEQRDGGQSDIAPGAGSPPIPTENPKPIRRRKPRRLPRRSSSDPLGRSPAPPEKLARVQLASSSPRPDRILLRSIRPKAAPVDSRRGGKTPAARFGRFVFRVAPPRRPPAPPQLRSACRAVGTPSAPELGTSKAFHPSGRAHGFDFWFNSTKPDTWNVAGLWVHMPFWNMTLWKVY